MRIVDVLYAPWAILPDKLLEIREVYLTHLRGEKVDIDAIETRLGQALNNQPKGFEVINGVAVLPVDGIIAKRMNLFTRISGGTSTQLLEHNFLQALGDPAVHSIILRIDSAGGQVDGTFELARTIRETRGRKPVVALGDSMMASAAYWIGSAADRVFITGETTTVGSIGVVATHTDVSRAEEMRGIKTTEITAGRFKRLDSSHRPLSDEARAVIQEHVDHVYSVFVENVAEHRGVDVETVLEKMADGRLFMGSKAMEAGLVDGVSTLGALIERLNQERETTGITGAFAPDPKRNGGTMSEDTKTLLAHEVEALEQAAFQRGKAEGLAEGATAERTRIRDVEAQLLPGHEALIAELKFDGKTTGTEAAVRVLGAERDKKAKVLTDLKADAPDPVPASEAPGDKAAKAEPDPNEVAEKAQVYQAEQKKAGRRMSISEAVRHVREAMGLK